MQVSDACDTPIGNSRNPLLKYSLRVLWVSPNVYDSEYVDNVLRHQVNDHVGKMGEDYITVRSK